MCSLKCYLFSGANDLKTVTQTADTTMLFGITCGLSAPYIAGQIDYAMTQVASSVKYS